MKVEKKFSIIGTRILFGTSVPAGVVIGNTRRGLLNHFMGAGFAESVGLNATDRYEGGNTGRETLANLTTTVDGLFNDTCDAYITRTPSGDNAGIAVGLSGQPKTTRFIPVPASLARSFPDGARI